MSDSPVSTSTIGDVAHISFDDGKANALDFAAVEGLRREVAAAIASGAKSVVVSGRPGKFSAGFNLKVMTGDADDARRLLEQGAHLALELFESPIPVVLAVSGHAIAMGGILTCTADYRVGAEGQFMIGLNEVANGMPVPRFAVELCRDRLSASWFTRCVQTATMCTPAEAVAANFLDEVVAPDDVIDRALAVAAGYASTLHPAPFAMTRRAVRGDLLVRLRAELGADMSMFTVSTD